MMIALKVQPRDSKATPAELREAGVLPAVVYGSKEASTPIAIPLQAFEKIWKEAGETTVITLEGLDEEKQTLIYDVQIHPITGRAVHADFYAIEKGQKVEVAIPLEFVGVAAAEKLGHVIVKALHEVEIEVAPAELPHTFEIDISHLENPGDHILASDIKLPPSASLKIDPNEILVTIAEAKEEPVEAPPAPAEGAEGAAPAEGEAAPAEGGEAPAEKKE